MYLVIEPMVTAANAKDVRRYQRLCQMEKQKGKLSPANMKTLVRLQTKLHKAGVIKPIGRAELEQTARKIYKELPFWKRWHLVYRYLKRQAYVKMINAWRWVKNRVAG